jgi:hypothetical protein
MKPLEIAEVCAAVVIGTAAGAVLALKDIIDNYLAGR